jgi:inosose dehydratase
MPLSRREFLHDVAAGAVACAIPFGAAARLAPKLRAAGMKVGYASITWGTNDLAAINDIAALGYAGIQMRANTYSRFRYQPSALRDLLAQRSLAFVALSSGAVTLDPSREAQTIAQCVVHAQFVRDLGGPFLQVTDERPSALAVTPEDCARLGRLLTEIGRRTAELGVALAYHPHMGTMGEQPDDAERILAAADPGFVKLLLDVAHYRQAGGDPAAAIRTHRDRLAFLHLKDVETIVPAKEGAAPYRFVELGHGRVDLDAVFRALSDVGYAGWGIVELDAVPVPDRTPAESAAINKGYLTAHGFHVP